MDKPTMYRTFIKQVLIYWAKREPHSPDDEYEEQIVIDDEHGHYLLISVGWDDMKRISDIHIHIDLRGDKIWIQTDWTDPCVVDLLREMGVPKSDIVLGFHAPYRRKMIKEYASG